MMIEAKVILDSVAPNGVRITTFELLYPRLIHAELMTHREFSRNAASSRAIPTPKKIERIRKDCAMPSEWGVNQKGMQAGKPLDEPLAAYARRVWSDAMENALQSAEALCGLRCAECYLMPERCICNGRTVLLDLHKQVANRVLEPFDHIVTVLTTTKLKNHWKLRLEVGPDGRPMADPTYFELATKWKAAYDASTPVSCPVDSWHLPYVNMAEDCEAVKQYCDSGEFVKIHYPSMLLLPILKMVSVGRCARTSYMRQGEGDISENVKLHDRLHKSGHWSPFEHQATPIGGFTIEGHERIDPEAWECQWCGGNATAKIIFFNQTGRVCMRCAQGHVTSGNFHGWAQYRKEFPGESGE